MKETLRIDIITINKLNVCFVFGNLLKARIQEHSFD